MRYIIAMRIAFAHSPRGHGLRGRDGKLIAAVIEFVLGVALDPVAADLMRIAQLQKLCPEVGVERRLFIGLFHPLRRQDTAQPLLSASMTYFESEYSSTMHGSLSARSAEITPVSSMRLFVVCFSPPDISFFAPP